MNYRVAELPSRQRAMLDFAWTLALAPQEIGEADRRRLRDVGFSEDDIFDIFDICDVAAFFHDTNRMAHGTDMIPNAACHAMDR